MSIIHLSPVGDEEPTAAQLAAIEAEWPQIQADLDQLDAEIVALSSGPHMSELDRRRVRRAEHRFLSVGRESAFRDEVSEVVA
ncbi:DUF6284 family protein [Kribbella monticola]|uniref:DUF6284 family protein n=1 Tax=Kribbella monticola TaxID=2185285 RepID=UPI000DD3140F|nr:DUF6284 family protein [Kribbella monticola]